MQIKRFEARNMTEALNLIKNELGDDAVILSARNIKKNGMLGSLKKAGVEVTAAIDNQNINYQKRNKYDSNKNKTKLPIRGRKFDSYRYKAYANNNQEGYEKRVNTISRDHKHSSPVLDQNRINIYRRLLSQGLNEEAASEIEWELGQNSIFQKDMPKHQVRKSLSIVFQKLGFTQADENQVKRKQNVMVFIGGTGVGKTTAVAKLAVNKALELNEKVGIINLDHHRVAATEQLQGYGNIVGIPISIATSKSELREKLKKYKNKETIIIDTPSVTLKSESRIKYLTDLFGKNKNFEIHLVISAPTKESDILGTMEKLKSIPIDYFVFSKIDETESYENLFNVLMIKKIPVSYITRDQGIKNGIKKISSHILADLILKRTDEMAIEEEKRSRLENKEKSTKNISLNMKNQFLANKNSDVYHVHSCKWTKMINKENIIIFQSSREAEIKKFKPCRSCCQDRYMKMMKKKETTIRERAADGRR